SLDAAEKLGRQANFLAEDLYEPARAQADPIRDRADQRQLWPLEFVQREADRRMAFEPAKCLRHEERLHHVNLGLRSGRSQHALAQLSGASAPQVVQAHMQVVQLVDGKIEERKSSAGPEVYPDHFGLAGGIDDEET